MVNLESAITSGGTRDREGARDRRRPILVPGAARCAPGAGSEPVSTWSRWRTTTAPTTGRTDSRTPCARPGAARSRSWVSALTGRCPHAVPRDRQRHGPGRSSPPTPRRARDRARSGRRAPHSRDRRRPRPAVAPRPPGGAPHDRPRRGRGGLPALGSPRAQGCPSPAQVRMARALADAGADVVVGTHAHVQQAAGWLGDTYVAYGLGNFIWYHDHRPDSGVLQLRVKDGRVVSDELVPAHIQRFGRPLPLHGASRTAAVARRRGLRGCSGLAARPLPASASDGGASPGDLPAYGASIRRIGPALRTRMRSTHGPRCPVPWSDLRYLRLSHVGFDGRHHLGEMVVAAVTRGTWQESSRGCTTRAGRSGRCGWPATSDGDDARSMAADNTSAYNCRRVAGSATWSTHAFGAAIDINPVENPYLVDGPSARRTVGPTHSSTGRLDRPCRPGSSGRVTSWSGRSRRSAGSGAGRGRPRTTSTSPRGAGERGRTRSARLSPPLSKVTSTRSKPLCRCASRRPRRHGGPPR